MENEVQIFEDKPDVDELKFEFERAKANLSTWMDKAEDAREVRFNEWAGKTGDGKKSGPEAFPWSGASDLDPNVINPLIDGDVATLTQALTKANLVAAPVESGDVASAKLVTEFLRWRMGTMDELMRESSIGANYLLQNGVTFFGTYWKQEKARKFEPISLEQIAQQSPELAMAIEDPEMKEGVEEMFYPLFPKLKKRRVKKMLNELRKNGETEIPTEKVVVNRPAVKAYELGRELIVDSNVIDLESARSIHCIHYYSPEALKQKVNEGWDEAWIDEAIEKAKDFYEERYSDSAMHYDYGTSYGNQHYEGLIRVVTTYRKELDEDDVPVVTKTCWTDEMDEAGFHEPVGYDEGRYPFVCITREHLNHRLLDSRGYPELLKSYELAVKTELDSRRDRASMSTMPPVEYQIGRRPERLGPGAQLGVRRRGEVGFMEIPRYSQASMEVEMQIRQLCNRITGRATGPDDAVEANVIKQHLVNCWLSGWKEVLKRVWCLDRTYSGPMIWFRVTNNEQGAQLILDETAELYDFNISWNSMNQDESKVIEKLDTVGKLMSQYDRQGVSRFDIYLRKVIEAIDPNLANELIMPTQEATTKEIIETSNDIAKIASGQVVNAPENGANPQLRLQVLQSYIQGSEAIPATDVQERLQSDENFAKRLQTYAGQLEFQQQQQMNARIGQLGTAPGNVPGTSMAA
jgi:hypothetical protein